MSGDEASADPGANSVGDGKATEPTERRLALVLNGGISLAVWMGGVTHEIENLRRASNGLAGPRAEGSSEGDRAETRILDAWREAAEQRHERFTVDVIGGTSAGGLNGVFLATAIARGAPMGALRHLWVEDAQLSRMALLKPQAPQAASLLNGDYFLESIRRALHAIRPEVPEDARPVTLTTTASAFGGRPRTVRDSEGAPFAQPDHRRRYRFRHSPSTIKYLPGEKDPFPVLTGHREFDPADAAATDALARAARATASLPVVFRPVEETAALWSRRVWPPWPTTEPGSEANEWLLDGGFLDNSPFEPVLELVTKQTVAAVWKRTVCFVVPSGPELEVETGSPAGDPAWPPPWPAVGLRAYGLPGEANFRNDMELLGALMRSGRSSMDVDRFSSLVTHLDTELEGDDGLAAAATRLMSYYRAARASAGVLEAVQTVQERAASALMSPTRTPDVHRILGAPHRWLPTALPDDPDGPWVWGLAAADRFVRLLMRTTRDRRDVPDQVRLDLNEQLHRIGAVRKAVLEELVATALLSTAWDRDDAAVASLVDDVYGRLQVPATLGTVAGEALATFTSAMPGTSDRLKVLRAGLSLEVIDGAPGLPVVSKPSPIFDFVRFGIGSVPAVIGGGDPDDEQSGRILYGTRLQHFAAFGRSEWREWDWMWGRIHAVQHLGALLEIDADRLDRMVLDVLAAEGTTVDRVRATLPALLAGDSDADLIRDLSADGRVREAGDALFDLLGNPAPTRPPMNGLLLKAGAHLAVLLAPTYRGRPRNRLVRLATWIPRRLLWNRLGR